MSEAAIKPIYVVCALLGAIDPQYRPVAVFEDDAGAVDWMNANIANNSFKLYSLPLQTAVKGEGR